MKIVQTVQTTLLSFIGGQISVNKIMTVLHQQLNHERPTTPRLLANIADLLGCMAAGDGGLRSGPAANPQWRNALQQLKVRASPFSTEMIFKLFARVHDIVI